MGKLLKVYKYCLKDVLHNINLQIKVYVVKSEWKLSYEYSVTVSVLYRQWMLCSVRILC